MKNAIRKDRASTTMLEPVLSNKLPAFLSLFIIDISSRDLTLRRRGENSEYRAVADDNLGDFT